MCIISDSTTKDPRRGLQDYVWRGGIITAVESGPEDTREAANLGQGGTGEGLNTSHPSVDEATAHVLTFSNTSVVDAFQSRREGAVMLSKASSTNGIIKQALKATFFPFLVQALSGSILLKISYHVRG
jgi:hypothetical protein